MANGDVIDLERNMKACAIQRCDVNRRANTGVVSLWLLAVTNNCPWTDVRPHTAHADQQNTVAHRLTAKRCDGHVVTWQSLSDKWLVGRPTCCREAARDGDLFRRHNILQRFLLQTRRETSVMKIVVVAAVVVACFLLQVRPHMPYKGSETHWPHYKDAMQPNSQLVTQSCVVEWHNALTMHM